MDSFKWLGFPACHVSFLGCTPKSPKGFLVPKMKVLNLILAYFGGWVFPSILGTWNVWWPIGDTPIFHWTMIMGGSVKQTTKKRGTSFRVFFWNRNTWLWLYWYIPSRSDRKIKHRGHDILLSLNLTYHLSQKERIRLPTIYFQG